MAVERSRALRESELQQQPGLDHTPAFRLGHPQTPADVGRGYRAPTPPPNRRMEDHALPVGCYQLGECTSEGRAPAGPPGGRGADGETEAGLLRAALVASGVGDLTKKLHSQHGGP